MHTLAASAGLVSELRFASLRHINRPHVEW
jgi:hypothetical protein